MPPMFVGFDVITEKKSSPDYASPEKQLVRQLDELERVSLKERDKHLGSNYFQDIEDFYALDEDEGNFPSFRPRVRIPQLQTLVLNEATDITDSTPKIYISKQGKRDEQREKFFQANWRQGCYNNRILFAVIWSLLSNLGFLQIGFNPTARRGRGRTWIESRDPKTVLPDPFARSDADWSWLEWYDWMYIDEVKDRWPDYGDRVRPRLYAAGEVGPYNLADSQLEFPEMSPLSNQGEQPNRKIFRDNRVRTRSFFILDNTRDRIKEELGSKSISLDLVKPRFAHTYPNGRWITECEGVVLADGNNWCPTLPDDERATFPLVRVAACPNIADFWGPPPIKFTRELQNLSERLYAQFTENIVRTNNGVIVMDSNCGLDPSAIGWIPGEVLMINPNSKPPQVISPQPLPQHMIQYPASLLALQKELQGHTQARQGQPGAGNLSPELYDASIHQAQTSTRLRTRLLAETLQRLAQIVFYVDARYRNIADTIAVPIRGDLEHIEWQPIDDSFDDYDTMLDEGSLKIMSASALKSVVAALAKAQMLPTSFVLDAFDIPNAKEVSEEKLRELELAAMGKLKRPR